METDFGDKVEPRGNEPIPTSLSNGEQPVMSNNEPNDVGENEVDYITTRGSQDDVNDAAETRSGRLIDDVNKRNGATEYGRNEHFDWTDSAVYHKNQKKIFAEFVRTTGKRCKFYGREIFY